jgi:hypothetical protein
MPARAGCAAQINVMRGTASSCRQLQQKVWPTALAMPCGARHLMHALWRHNLRLENAEQYVAAANSAFPMQN